MVPTLRYPTATACAQRTGAAASHPGEIALASSRRLRSMLALRQSVWCTLLLDTVWGIHTMLSAVCVYACVHVGIVFTRGDSSTAGYLNFHPTVSLQFNCCDLSVREKDWRAASQAFERMHNTLLSHRVKT